MDAVNIADVIGEFVQLKKKGQNYLGLSPFNKEKTSSFNVVPHKNIFKDFSSGKGGSVITFLMELEGMSYPEALRYLAKKYNIELEEKEETAEEIKQRNEKDSLFIVNEWAQKHFHRQLTEGQEGVAIGLSYLKERGFRRDIIDKFKLGYCPEGRVAFTEEALKNGHKKEYLVATGLTIDKDGRHFDRFSGRVIFPIHSPMGKVLGFGGRTLKTDKKIAKYLNSPESSIYHKGKTLYGIAQAKAAIVKEEKCYLVEGYTDVLRMHQAGLENVVASSGTALTPDQVGLIKRFSKNLTILFDGDPAGLQAATRGIDIVLEEGLNVKVVILPEGEDPDSFAREKSSGQILDFFEKEEKDFIRFKTEYLMGQAKNDPVKKSEVVRSIIRSIAVIPDGILRSTYISDCARQMDFDEEQLFSELAKMRSKKVQKVFEQNRQKERAKKQGSPVQARVFGKVLDFHERDIVRLLLNYGNETLFTRKAGEDEAGKANDEGYIEISVSEYILDELAYDDLHFQNPSYARFLDEFKRCRDEGITVDTNTFVFHQEKGISEIAADLLTTPYHVSMIWEKRNNRIRTEAQMLKEVIPETLISYKLKTSIQQTQDIKEQMRVARDKNDIESENELLKKYILLTEYRKKLSSQWGQRVTT